MNLINRLLNVDSEKQVYMLVNNNDWQEIVQIKLINVPLLERIKNAFGFGSINLGKIVDYCLNNDKIYLEHTCNQDIERFFCILRNDDRMKDPDTRYDTKIKVAKIGVNIGHPPSEPKKLINAKSILKSSRNTAVLPNDFHKNLHKDNDSYINEEDDEIANSFVVKEKEYANKFNGRKESDGSLSISLTVKIPNKKHLAGLSIEELKKEIPYELRGMPNFQSITLAEAEAKQIAFEKQKNNCVEEGIYDAAYTKSALGCLHWAAIVELKKREKKRATPELVLPTPSPAVDVDNNPQHGPNSVQSSQSPNKNPPLCVNDQLKEDKQKDSIVLAPPQVQVNTEKKVERRNDNGMKAVSGQTTRRKPKKRTMRLYSSSN